ncbi:transmembrane protein 43-like [Haliotis cracherodii]|uniref:transmembrane protein 43-like n=1 Tax=Haliotis cracherodii TaxID=6455 RepID=UPI0039E7BBA4
MYRQYYPDAPGMHNMPGNSHTSTTYRRNPNFCERIGNSLVGIVVGFILIFVASWLLFWNEGRAVQTARSLEEGLSIVVPLQTTDVAFEGNNGKLVHLQGHLQTHKMLYDPVYHISVPAVKLRRSVEMYQWVEHETRREYNEGGDTRVETTYSYDLEWRSELIRSSSFDSSVGHQNPTSLSVSSVTHVADKVLVGSFSLSNGLIEKVTDFKHLTPTYIGQPQDPSIKLYMGALYHSFNPAMPQVGDIRVKFEYSGLSQDSALGPAAKVSVVARQINERLLPYKTEAGDQIELLYFGDMSPKEIFGKEQAQNAIFTWALRFGGWLLMFVAFGCITSIITTIVDWLPIVRELVAMGVTTMNLALSISLSLTVIALGWITYRPWLGLTILALAVAPLFLSKLSPRGSNYSRDTRA